MLIEFDMTTVWKKDGECITNFYAKQSIFYVVFGYPTWTAQSSEKVEVKTAGYKPRTKWPGLG